MNKLKLTILIVISFTSFSFAQQADEIIGKYHLPNKLDIEIFKNNGKYFGEIIALNGYEDGQVKDINNPESLKRNDSLVGMVIIKNLEYKRMEEWSYVWT